MRAPVAFFALSLAGCAVPIRASISPEKLAQAVRAAEVSRDATAPALPLALGHEREALRRAALVAVARTAQAGTSSLAVGLLGDPSPEVATWAAFALGQIADAQAEAALRAGLELSVVPEQVLLALGRAGTATTASALAARLEDPRAEVRRAAAIALGLLAKRLGKVMPGERHVARLGALVRDPDGGVRFGAVYALLRIGGARAAVALAPALADADPEVRATAARGLGVAGAQAATLDTAGEDPDWRVRVERVRALLSLAQAAQGDPREAALARLESALASELRRFLSGGTLASGTAMHVLLALARGAPALGEDAPRLLRALEKLPWERAAIPPEVAPDLARLACAVAHAQDELEGVVRRVRACGDASLPAWRREQLAARLLGKQGTGEAVEALAALAGHQDPRVRVAAVEGLGEIDRKDASALLDRLLDSNDPFVVGAAADQLVRPERVGVRPAGLAERLGPILERHLALADAGLSLSLLDAIGALGEASRVHLARLEVLAADPRAAIRRRAAAARGAITGRQPPLGAPPPGVAPPPRPAPRAAPLVLVLKTTRGRLVLELDGALAPATTGAFADLAARGFFRDKSFHRVVSDFVVQGGCPRGDGYGGPGYTLEDEVSPAPFARGAVGIATSGRDTGGSQFFVMHAYHPHLDGGYAVVGRVLEGMEVADAIQEDDRILELEVGEGASPAAAR